MALLILADDLTGAADCAARCRHAGLATTVFLRPPAAAASQGAICLTSDSRHLDAARAAQRVHELAAGLREHAACTWYKKIDSTLRGHIGRELDALLDALGRPCAVVCPAFPAQQRGLEAGYLTMAQAPARPAHLPTLLAHQSRRKVAAVALEQVRAGLGYLCDSLLEARRKGMELLVVDALTDMDLRMVLDAALRALPGALLCGSAGLAGTLAADYARQAPHYWSATGILPDSPGVEPLGGGRPTSRLKPRLLIRKINVADQYGTARPAPVAVSTALLAIGSGSAMAQRQIEYLRQRHAIAVLEPGAEAPAGHIGDILLRLPPPPPGAMLDGPEARRMAERLADAALPLIAAAQPGLLVLSGGDTAINLLERMGVSELAVQSELLPGIPLTLGIDAAGRPYAIVLKAGNHGDEAALATLLARARTHYER